jgi:hypothetical protein
MISLSCIAEYTTVAKDVVLTIAGGIGAYVAVKGLNTWNRQLKGGVEYELTRRLLKQTYRFREAIKGVRNPVMWAGEMYSPAPEEAKNMTLEQKRFYGMSTAYQKRWDKVTEVQTDLQMELLEAEALWGREVHEKIDQLFTLQHELWVAVHFYVTACNPDAPEGTRDAMNKVMQKNRDILYEISGETVDEFANDIAKAIGSIETFLKPYLRK